MIKSILFDLDGVLVDSVRWHEVALNRALQEAAGFQIDESGNEGLEALRGKLTRDKLHILLEQKRITPAQLKRIPDLKKKHLVDVLAEYAHEDPDKIRLLEETRRLGLSTGCVTNSNRDAATSILSNLGLLESFDVVVTGSEVRSHKPCSEGYIIAMVSLQALPKECVVVEDTAEGVVSARNTGAHVWVVKGPAEVTWENLNRFLEEVR